VVVPARNEEERLAACLRSIERARRRLSGDVTVRTVVVLDGCTDDTARVAARFRRVSAIAVGYGNVGRARAAGVERLLRERMIDPVATWLANTDADSIVPTNWLVEQARLANEGADVMVGTVQPKQEELTAEQRAAWDSLHPEGRAVGHVHGANLGMRATTYRAVGGFAAQPEHEDVEIVARLHLAGARVVATDACPVTTSGRSLGRTPSGYAGYLRTLVREDREVVGNW
jgi:glycosyltransferase involved in cell wall biosynthesis